MPGKVFLVGAGPGDPGLITVKGLACLRQADVVVYDRLLDASLLQEAPKAELIFVGKERGRQALTQAEINQLLLDRAAAGQSVARLKGGDPFVFGRGGEEAQVLARNAIPFEVVPGITSAVAAAAYAGIPVTQRGVATCFTVVSGSEDPAKSQASIHWPTLAHTGGTLVALMSWANLQSILQTLRSEGMASDTPVALVQWGTWQKQRTIVGSLSDVVERAQTAGLTPPVVAIIGPVVNLRQELAWFDQRPLFGKKVLVTRSRSQASHLRQQLEAQGADPVELPTIEIAPLTDYAQLDAALSYHLSLPYSGDRGGYWLIFASVNAVEAVFDRLQAMGKDSRALAGAAIGAIGPATAAALAKRGINADFIPRTSVSEAVVAQLAGQDWDEVPVLLPGADIGRDVLAQGLAQKGASVTQVAAYRTITPPEAGANVQRLLKSGVDIITFTSSSTVRNLISLLSGDTAPLKSSLIACIGPVTAAAAQEAGLRVDLVAPEATVEGLVGGLVNYYQD